MMLGATLLVLGSTLVTAVNTAHRSRARSAAHQALASHFSGDGCGDGVTTTPVLIYAGMDNGNSLYSLRGRRQEESEDTAELDTETSGDAESGGPAAAEGSTAAEVSPLCLAIYKSLRNSDKHDQLTECIKQNKEVVKDASLFLQRFDEEGAQELLQPHFASCLHKNVNLETAQLTQSGGCLSGLTKDYVEFQMKNKGKGISMQCRAEACIKFKQNNTDECAHKYDNQLEDAENLTESARVYETILTKCADVSELCARQNGYPMAWKANQQMLRSIGLNGIR